MPVFFVIPAQAGIFRAAREIPACVGMTVKRAYVLSKVTRMSLTEKDVTKIGKLARIELSAEDTAHFQEKLSSILKWVEQLQEVNTDGVPQLSSVSEQKLPWRKDEVTDGHIQEKIVKNAPASEHGCFVVPKVIDQG